eukprot:scaffold25185_cov36-Phaeocystis_antarctica.AAC.1
MFRPYGIYDVVQHGVRCNDGTPQGPSTALALVQTTLGLTLRVPHGCRPDHLGLQARSHRAAGATT